MPSIRASVTSSLKGWQPTPATPAASPAQSTPPPDQTAPGRSPFMLASMPLMASTADAFTRQFYSPSNLPQQRILPARKGTL